ncbi:carboxypeptidase M32 [Polycladomyces subterraneus]|uniref:Metal-dependent carboxypeptidase n=1 Tax=Polycladomyces subterraneus TaxID=1016997 RepID=A0ABT8ILX3_9BACL|nr:carboxypeptidase M32 [Polycladomyces subterraneus]MDN4593742.1 carboxypeptidase M32 [Polycladomyces subterraneus]
MDERLYELKKRLTEINDLHAAAALLSWDQSTYMPEGGAEARGRQIATLHQLAHEKLTDDRLGQLLDDLKSYEQSLPPDSDDAALIRVARKEYERAVNVPASFIAKFSNHTATTYNVWVKAKAADDFSLVRPYLEQTLEYSRELASFFPGYEHIADPLIDYVDERMTAKKLQALFGELRKRLVPLVQAITEQEPVDDACVRQHFPERDQLAFGELVIRQLGFDFRRGRQDKSPHPFMTKFSLGDVRITTRVKENDLTEALFSTIHEAGHAMYELGISEKYEGTPLANGTSSGVHESQSRLWENIVGRSRPFWRHFYPRLQKVFPSQLGNVDEETFYRAINKVERSLIRTDADEVTYNLHVILRFDLELAMLDGRLAVRDLPEAWRERYQSDLGIVPTTDSMGIMQDVHWYADTIGGAFQCYTLGNILSGQFYAAAKRANPHIEEEIARGEFGTLHQWLKENIYQHGKKYTADELVQRVTGESLSIEPYMDYLTKKYTELYKL